jgi:hypothetical protein
MKDYSSDSSLRHHVQQRPEASAEAAGTHDKEINKVLASFNADGDGQILPSN